MIPGHQAEVLMAEFEGVLMPGEKHGIHYHKRIVALNDMCKDGYVEWLGGAKFKMTDLGRTALDRYKDWMREHGR